MNGSGSDTVPEFCHNIEFGICDLERNEATIFGKKH